jgi:hypothetical protein
MKIKTEENYFEELNQHLSQLVAKKKKSALEIIEDFPNYVPRQTLARFLVRHELFKMTLNVKGSIVECGVFRGAGLMSWAQLSSIYEPINYHREIVGFDTFSGFPDVVDIDKGNKKNINAKKGGITADSYEELNRAIELYNNNRFLSHIEKVKLAKGDFLKTGPEFLRKNKHFLISLLYLDFDIYKPTKEALKIFLPRMPKGAIIAFDEIHNQDWPGETVALLSELDLNKYKLTQFNFEPNMSYIIL